MTISRGGKVAILSLGMAALSGCVAAAAIPAVAGGLAAKKAADYSASKRPQRPSRRQAERQAQAVAEAPAALPNDLAAMRPGAAYAGSLPSPVGGPATELPVVAAGGSASTKEGSGKDRGKRRSRAAAAPAAPVALSSAPPLPADPREIRPGITYTGALPPPYAAPATEPAPARQQGASWTDVGRYVAGLPAAQTDSALLARGSNSDAPSWAPCAGKPRAVLARLETAATQKGESWRFDTQAQQWLEALQTLEVPVVFTSPAPASARAAIEGAFRTAGLAKLLDLGDLRLGLTPPAMPAERAGIAAKKCVVAVVGREASDFPNALTPEASPPALAGKWSAGWFRIAAD